jgi:beta-galactosidase beta subunit
MIQDLLSNSAKVESLHPLFPNAFQWLKNFKCDQPDGKYEICGQDCVAGVQRYKTKPAVEKMGSAQGVRRYTSRVCRTRVLRSP